MGKVYVNSSAMSGWKTKMNQINSTAVNDVEELDKLISELRSSFKGDFADSYIESISKFSNSVKKSHESMKDIDAFLDTIVNVMNNQ